MWKAYMYFLDRLLVLRRHNHKDKSISSGGIVRLPKFEMTIFKAEANQKHVLAIEGVHIITIYVEYTVCNSTGLACYSSFIDSSLMLLCSSISMEKLKLHPNAYVMIIQLLVRNS